MSEQTAENDAPYRAVLGLILEHVHVAVSNDFIVVGDVDFDAPAPIRRALTTLMEEWVDGEATCVIPPGTRRICYCAGRGDDYHLSGDTGCVVVAPEVTP